MKKQGKKTRKGVFFCHVQAHRYYDQVSIENRSLQSLVVQEYWKCPEKKVQIYQKEKFESVRGWLCVYRSCVTLRTFFGRLPEKHIHNTMNFLFYLLMINLSHQIKDLILQIQRKFQKIHKRLEFFLFIFYFKRRNLSKNLVQYNNRQT